MPGRLPAHLEAKAIMRRVEAEGGFAAILRKGDPDKGALTLVIRERDRFRGLLERVMAADFEYRWSFTDSGQEPSSGNLDEFIARKSRFDADFWLIELDIADPERFIAETISSG